jgi:hypothetical protein
VCGEGAEVPQDVVEDWSQRLPELLAGYDPKDVFNADETGLYYRALPNRTYVIKGDPAKGLKGSKERMTVLIACSAAGEKLTPLVIGRSAKPRCFRGAGVLPVRYVNNKKAWMTGQLFTEWMDRLNNRMKGEGRKILLLVDNCAAHPAISRSNVKLVFLPPNTTSKLQPCDAGIIQCVKLHYRKKLLRHVITELDDYDSPTELIKDVTVLDAILWLDAAWERLQPSTIMKCFRKCGFETPLDAPSTSTDPSDPSESNESPEKELGPQFKRVMGDATWSDFVSCDDDVIATAPEEDPTPSTSTDPSTSTQDSDEDDVEALEEAPPPSVSHKKARDLVKQLMHYALQSNNPGLLSSLRDFETNVQDHQLSQANNSAQTSIKDFFSG